MTDLLAARPQISSRMRLQWEPVQSAHVLLYPEGMVKLNASAGEILKRCTGEHTVEEIVQQLESAFGTQNLTNDVRAFVELAVSNRWLELDA